MNQQSLKLINKVASGVVLFSLFFLPFMTFKGQGVKILDFLKMINNGNGDATIITICIFLSAILAFGNLMGSLFPSVLEEYVSKEVSCVIGSCGTALALLIAAMNVSDGGTGIVALSSGAYISILGALTMAATSLAILLAPKSEDQ